MRRVRVRSSLSRERLRDSAAGLREPPPALGMAFTGMIATTKGIGVQVENFNAVLPIFRIQLSKHMKTGAQSDASAHGASWALFVNKSVGETVLP